ncbi:hypothetical protein TTRE_0000967101 [Trichuris trichiura]|uniref:Uncharacterized protein n=1 Tax=Trichuris trichiura TaxID=36087 RepID=A0A077ZN57_TRITR|nr:hypothetical protein TTRE_0000967101 [Trichuris trichiura]
MGTSEHEFIRRSSAFHGPSRAFRTPRETRRFAATSSLSPDNPVPATACLMKKRKLFPELPTAARRVRRRYRAHQSRVLPVGQTERTAATRRRGRGSDHRRRGCTSSCLGSGISTGFPFERYGVLLATANKSQERRHTVALGLSPRSQDRLTHVQLLFTWNPSPLRPSRFSLE